MGNLFKQWRLQTLKKQGLICPSEGTPVVLVPLLSSHELPFQTKKPREQTAWCADLCNSHLRITPYSPIALVSSSVACCLNKKSPWSKQTLTFLKANLCIYMKLQCLSFFFRISFLWNKQTSTWSDWWTIWTWTSLIFLFSPAPPLQTASGRFPPINFDMFFRVARATGFCAGPRPIAAIPHFSSRFTLVTSVLQSPE